MKESRTQPVKSMSLTVPHLTGAECPQAGRLAGSGIPAEVHGVLLGLATPLAFDLKGAGSG